MKVNELTVAVIGGGVIGAGWIARFAENGIDVSVYDLAPDAEKKAAFVLDNAERAYAKLTMAPRFKKGNIRFVTSIDEAVQGAGLIVEAVPEEPGLKKSVWQTLAIGSVDEQGSTIEMPINSRVWYGLRKPSLSS